MCGIGGMILNNKRAEPSALDRMCDIMAHRGPDGRGIYAEKNLGLAHTRLSIIDLEGAKQPMHSSCGQYVITYNGELYNYKSLRKELEGNGVHFSLSSDTEVVLYAYKIWGESCLKRFRGMFSFAIIDYNKHLVFCARDHFGIKPFVYVENSAGFFFGSELSVLTQQPLINLTLDFSALDKYLWLGYIPTPLTIYSQAKKLPPGHSMVVDLNGKIIRQHEYFFPNAVDHEEVRTEGEWIERMESVLEESVALHCQADVPFGSFLSGGIDSTLISGYMKKVSGIAQTYTMGFDSDTMDETPYAKIAGQTLGLNLNIEHVPGINLDLFEHVINHMDEPFGDSSIVPTYQVCKIARKHAPVALSGDGGDEFFLGYPRYYRWKEHLNNRLGVSRLKGLLLPLAHTLNPSRYSSLYPKNTAAGYLGLFDYLKPEVREMVWSSNFTTHIDSSLPLVEEAHRRSRKMGVLRQVKTIDIRSYLCDDILKKVDLASMMNSLEVRPPIIDVEVHRLLQKMPQHMLVDTGKGKFTGKRILKLLLQKHFSEAFLYRQKAGFGLPLDEWFVESNPLYRQIEGEMLSPDSPLSDYFDLEGLKLILQRRNYPRSTSISGPVWLLFVLHTWLAKS
jgi:asparagine synthase (glutamine-hydrolysing)